jgi:hypothetical protein
MSTSWGRCAPTAWTARRRSERARGRWFTLVHAIHIDFSEQDIRWLQLNELQLSCDFYRYIPMGCLAALFEPPSREPQPRNLSQASRRQEAIQRAFAAIGEVA